MPKMPKVASPPETRKRRHNPLEDDLLATGPLRSKGPKRRSKEEKNEEEHFVDSRASQQILKISQDLAHEEQDERPKPPAEPPVDSFALETRFGRQDQPQESEESHFDDDDDVWGDDEEVVVAEVDPEDLVTFRKFLPEDEDPLLRHGWPGSAQPAASDVGESSNLADIILQKIYAHEAGEAQFEDEEPEEVQLPPQIVEVYTKVGIFLSRYRSGPLAKPIKILPAVPNWEEVLELTNPQEWTPNATSAVARVFVAAKSHVVEHFMEFVMLDKVRGDISENKKLHPHYFKALEVALFKPSAWFKGFLFPLVGSGTCTLREATIISGVLKRHHIPVLQAAAALSGMCDIAAQEASQGTEGGGATNILIHTILTKGYALPYQIIDMLVFHFLRFRTVDPASIREADFTDLTAFMTDTASARCKLPVIWHQCLLEFARKYKNDITEDSREALLDLLISHGHRAIGPEIRKELLAGRNRGEEIPQGAKAFDGDDTMMVG